MSLQDSLANMKFERSLLIGPGGSGGDSSITTRNRRVERLCDILGLRGEERRIARTALRKLYTILVLDSDDREPLALDAAFAGDDSEVIEAPDSYKKFESCSGREILEKIRTEPFAHLSAQAEHEELLKSKSSESEAEGIRFHGYVNGLVNIRVIRRQIALAVKAMRDLAGSKAWQQLIGLGLPLNEAGFRIDVCGSGAGGQASGILVLVLALLALEIEDIRGRCKVFVHFLLPGFHPAQNEADAIAQRTKSLSVLSDLAIMKNTGRPLDIPFPGGALSLRARHSSDIYNYLYIYEPQPTEADPYKSFLNRVSQTIVDATLSASAADLRRALSNANSLARSAAAQKHLTAIAGGKR